MKNYGDLRGCYPPWPIAPSSISIILHKILNLIHLLLNIRPLLLHLIKYEHLHYLHPTSRASFSLYERGRENAALSELHQTFKAATAQTSVLFNLVYSRQTGLFQCKYPFIDKSMIIAEPTVSSARLYIRPGFKTIS